MHPRRRFSAPGLLAMTLTALLILPLAATAQTRVDPGFNLFSHDQDIEIGQESAREVERQFPVVEARAVAGYVDRLGGRLADNTPGYDYPYQFHVLDVADVNAFALPGGFMYLNRGLLVHADGEAELAAVMAHEIAHVALRHGTSRASKAYLGEAGLSLITGLIGGRTASDIVGAVGGFGLNSLFLSFSRDDEREADAVAAQILARSGYDPLAMVRMFESLQRVADESGAGSVPTFFSSHPPYDERLALVREEVRRIGTVQSRRPVGDLRDVKAELRSMPAPRPMEHYMQGGTAEAPPRDRSESHGEITDVRIEPASSNWITVRQESGYFALEVPDNWQVRKAERGFGLSVVPPGGMVRLADGRTEIVYGVVLDHFVPDDVRSSGRWWSSFTTDTDWEDPNTWLETASQQLVDALRESNPHLEPRPRSSQAMTIDRARALIVDLEGHNPITDRRERVTVVTRETDADGHLIYALLIAPDTDWEHLDQVFGRMINSLSVNDSAVHGAHQDR